jgi:hypothetical protein
MGLICHVLLPHLKTPFYGLTVAVFPVYNIRQGWGIGKGEI